MHTPYNPRGSGAAWRQRIAAFSEGKTAVAKNTGTYFLHTPHNLHASGRAWMKLIHIIKYNKKDLKKKAQ